MKKNIFFLFLLILFCSVLVTAQDYSLVPTSIPASGSAAPAPPSTTTGGGGGADISFEIAWQKIKKVFDFIIPWGDEELRSGGLDNQTALYQAGYLLGFMDTETQLGNYVYWWIVAFFAWFMLWFVVVLAGGDSKAEKSFKWVLIVSIVAIAVKSVYKIYLMNELKNKLVKLKVSELVNREVGSLFWPVVSEIIISLVLMASVLLFIWFIKKDYFRGNVTELLKFLAGKIWKVFMFPFIFAFLMIIPVFGRIFGIFNLTVFYGDLGVAPLLGNFWSQIGIVILQSLTLAVVIGIVPQLVYAGIRFKRVYDKHEKEFKKERRKRLAEEFMTGMVEGTKGIEKMIDDEDDDTKERNQEADGRSMAFDADVRTEFDEP